MSHSQRRLPSASNQNGSVYIIAIFVLVVMGFLGAALTRMEWSNNDALTRDALGTQAWLLSHSANELVLTHMYPLNASAAVSSNCTSPMPSDIQNALLALASQQANCSEVSTVCSSLGTLDDEDFYKVESTAICGTGINHVQRMQEVWVKE
ncbi:MSHA biogenesis protein MshP [uncultured Vibrio sp.]|uniref:MSHA biogenesis protein MshP n=1 Tax=uncultured Vibrio sp. TaxID=114054 RepID=UPI0009137CBB|nr:MSHA biogenesis protein MshP [uncultured Vibrio sp.]OIQ24855.1 MAG: MSHA biogenesis protein MshP [Vibrio sp. MedPE-SWchi]